jgi:DHA1 family bicyclomycin/chloramphenicol resistance-like MFS transporter
MLRPDTLALTALLALISALGPVSTDMYLPSLPDIGRVLGATPAQVQLTLSAYLVAFAVGQIGYGPVSDRFGRRRVLLAALAIFSLANLLCSFATSIEMLILARALQALGGSGAIVVVRAVVRDLYSGARAGRELSMMGTIMALAPIIAPLIGGALQAGFGWRANFLVATAVGLIAALIVARSLPETLHTRSPDPISLAGMLHGFGVLLQNAAFRAHISILAASFAGLFVWISGSSFVLQDVYGLSPFGFGLAFAICSVGYMIGTSLAAYAVSRIGLDRTIGVGCTIQAVGGIGMALCVALGFTAIGAVLASTVVYLVGLGLVMPQVMAGAMTPFPERAGAASSLLGFAMQTSAAILGAIVGHLLAASVWPIAGPMALMSALALVVWLAASSLREPDGKESSKH